MSDSNNRYIRQQLVPQLSGNASKKLSAARVLIVGAGGLGSPVSLFLAGAGVGHITLVDADVVSLSNLHRQILFQESDIKHSKAETAKNRLEGLNSQISVTAINQKLGINNAENLVSEASVVVDAADNFLVSYLLSDLCFEKRIPLVSASVLTTHGYVGVFCGTQQRPAPSLRAVFPAPSSQANNCDTAGVTGPSVGIIGSYQAQEVLKVITGDESQLLGKLMSLDLWNYRQHIIDFSDAKEPNHKASFMALQELAEEDILLDVRTAQEHEDKPLPKNAINIPLHELPERLDELDHAQQIHCACQSGQRALVAAALLFKNGFNKVVVISP